MGVAILDTEPKPRNQGTSRYDVTPMRRGGFRAECHVETHGVACGWYEDHDKEKTAEQRLAGHRKMHNGRWRRSRRES